MKAVDTALDAMVPELLRMVADAGRKILEIYDAPVEHEKKEDGSPLTIADKRSFELLRAGLSRLYPGIPLLSEDGAEEPYAIRKGWKEFWLVDPLDGTKEFLEHNGQFTINIALIREKRPVVGVIYVPCARDFYFAVKGKGAFKAGGNRSEDIIKAAELLPLYKGRPSMAVIASRSHMSDETAVYIENLRRHFKDIDLISAGSSLKFCLVAEGGADIYPRFGPTMEWDTAAGQIIVEEAGGAVISARTGKPLEYAKEDLHNPYFMVVSKRYEPLITEKGGGIWS